VLHDVVEEAIARKPRVVVNVGCAEGYYTVGLARRLPEATVHAYDLSASARKMTLALARLNDVDKRVRAHGRCRGFGPAVDLVVCDIDGGEGGLLHPSDLREAMVIVETHDNAVPGTTRLLAERFVATHETETLAQKVTGAPKELGWLSDAELTLALDEGRPSAQRWLVMRPRRARVGTGPYESSKDPRL